MSKTLITSAILVSALVAAPALAQEASATTTTTTTAAPSAAAPVTASTTTTTTAAPADAPAATTTTTDASFPGANGAQIKSGATIYDPAGNVVGTVKSVDANGATVETGNVTVGIPLAGIGPHPKGLVIALTKEQIEAQAKAATPNG